MTDALLGGCKSMNAGGGKKSLRLIHIVCEDDDIDTIMTLLKRGADINVRDNERKTPLHIAVSASGTPVEA